MYLLICKYVLHSTHVLTLQRPEEPILVLFDHDSDSKIRNGHWKIFL